MIYTCELLLWQCHKFGTRDYETLSQAVGGKWYRIFTEVGLFSISLWPQFGLTESSTLAWTSLAQLILFMRTCKAVRKCCLALAVILAEIEPCPSMYASASTLELIKQAFCSPAFSTIKYWVVKAGFFILQVWLIILMIGTLLGSIVQVYFLPSKPITELGQNCIYDLQCRGIRDFSIRISVFIWEGKLCIKVLHLIKSAWMKNHGILRNILKTAYMPCQIYISWITTYIVHKKWNGEDTSLWYLHWFGTAWKGVGMSFCMMHRLVRCAPVEFNSSIQTTLGSLYKGVDESLWSWVSL